MRYFICPVGNVFARYETAKVKPKFYFQFGTIYSVAVLATCFYSEPFKGQLQFTSFELAVEAAVLG